MIVEGPLSSDTFLSNQVPQSMCRQEKQRTELTRSAPYGAHQNNNLQIQSWIYRTNTSEGLSECVNVILFLNPVISTRLVESPC